MPLLPTQTDSSIAGAVQTTDYPSTTWRVDKRTNRLCGMADGLEAMAQAVEVCLNIERFAWQIYSPNIGMESQGLIGSDFGFITSELGRRVREALAVDSRVLQVDSFQFQQDGDVLTASFTVQTIYGPLERRMEVVLS